MSEPKERPLLTFAVVAFNQARFIREAVEAAFAQTYSPLEIVLSDDCSSDGTFDLMQKMAAAYRGPNKVVLNRNPVRRSIGGHLNRVMEISHGELIVGAAGDDVSFPERTRLSYEAWERSSRKATSIHTDFVQVDDNGQTMQQVFKTESQVLVGETEAQPVEPLAFVQTLKPVVFGCTHAFSRQLFRRFGPLPEQVIHEDDILAFRSVLAGQLLYINQVLVKYRVHGGNVYVRVRERGTDLKTLERQEERVRRDYRNRETMYEAFLLDLETARAQGFIGSAEATKAAQEANRKRRRAWLFGQFLDSGLFAKWRVLCQLQREGLDRQEFKMLAWRLLPRAWLLRLRLVRGFLP